MNTRRWIAAAVFSVVILLSLAAIVVVYAVNNSQTVTVYQLKADHHVGDPASPGDVTALPVKASGSEFDYAFTDDTSTLQGRVYTNNVVAGQILGKQDVDPQNPPALISLGVANAPALNPGDLVNLYVQNGSDQEILIGKNITVNAPGNPMTIAVDPRTAPYWVVVSTQKLNITAIKAYQTGAAPNILSVNQAISFLCGCNFGGGSSSVAPSSPAPSP